jgi:hypothetical protein
MYLTLRQNQEYFLKFFSQSYLSLILAHNNFCASLGLRIKKIPELLFPNKIPIVETHINSENCALLPFRGRRNMVTTGTNNCTEL